MSKTAEKASGIYQSARENPFVNRLIEDAELRENVLDALQSARQAYGRIADSSKSPVEAVSHDKKVQRDLRRAADSLREASEQLRKPKRKKKRLGKLIVLVLAAVGITLAVSEDARKAVLDTLFGPEEEFEYTGSANGGAS